MLEAQMLDLTRGLPGLHQLFDASHLEVEMQLEALDTDDEAFAEAWFRQGDDISDGRIDEAYELSPSEVITLPFA